MFNLDMIARLADSHEFAELTRYLQDKKVDELEALARRTFANPEDHDRIEWERLRARWKAIDGMLALPANLRDKKKEPDERHEHAGSS